jgi:predicted permease
VLVVALWSVRPFESPRAHAAQLALRARLRAIPGVASVSAAQSLPVGGALWDRRVDVEGYTARPDEPNVAFNVIAPAYFATLGIPLITGREFSDSDGATSPRVAVVNQSFAKYFFGNARALGRRVTSVGVNYEVVGVVGDTKYQDLREPMLRTMYIPWMQREGDAPSAYRYLIRTAGDPLSVAALVDRAVREGDPDLRMRNVTTYDAVIAQSISMERIMAMLGALFGILALLIAGVGMFGLLAYRVARRTNELGVRMVLGASRSSAVGLVVRDIVRMLVPGVVFGGAAAFVVTRVLSSILFELTPTDLRIFSAAAIVLTCAAVVAGWWPARRAARVNPTVALRHE